MTIEALLASGIGWVAACGIYLLLRARTFPVVLGLTLLGYAVNVFIFAMGRLRAGAPPILIGDSARAGPLPSGLAPPGGAASEASVGVVDLAVSDPLPQALVLTAIVIGFATTGFVIEMALRSRVESGTDHVDGEEPPR